MKISKLEFTNWWNHENTKIEFSPVNVFIGPHGSGKTLILNGVEFLLTGMCRVMENRYDEKEMIGPRAKSTNLMGEFEFAEGVRIIERRINKSGSTLVITDADGSLISDDLSKGQEKIYELLGFGKEVAQVLFDSIRAAKMSTTDRKKLLQGLFASTEDKILDYLKDNGITQLQPEHQNAIKSSFATHGLGDEKKGAYGYCVGKRQEFKRQAKDLEALGDSKEHRAPQTDDSV